MPTPAGRASAEGATADTPWLESLVDGTSREALQRRVNEAIGRGDEGAIAAGSLSLQLFDRMADQARQGRELSALDAVAVRLASVQGVAAMLQEIVAHSRSLLGADVAYLLLRSPLDSGRLRIEVVDGSIASGLRGIEMSVGEGLAGEVLRTNAPAWVESYAEATHFQRVQEADIAAANEHLQGMLGVPLRTGDDVVGVLIAAERGARRFENREIDLLSRFAMHGAIAVRNAQLLENLQRAMSDLRSANLAMERSLEQRSRAAALREALTDAVVAGDSADRLLGLLSSAVRLDLTMLRGDVSTGRLLGGDPGLGEWEWLAEILPERPQSVVGPMQSRPGGARVACVPVMLANGCAGWIVAASGDDIDEESLQLLSIGATFLALAIAHERTVFEVELRARGELIHALLDPDAPESVVMRRAMGVGVDLSRVSTVAVLKSADDSNLAAREVLSRLSQRSGVWVGDHGSEALVLARGVEPTRLRRWIEDLTVGRGAVTAGVSACRGGVESIRRAVVSGRQTVLMLEALDLRGSTAEDAELGVYRGIFSSAGIGELNAFVDRVIGPLLSHDAERRRALTDTVAAYLRSAQHHARTCEQLSIHPNTLYQRLDRVSELLGPEWREPERVFEIQLALRFRQLRARIESDRGEAPS